MIKIVRISKPLNHYSDQRKLVYLAPVLGADARAKPLKANDLINKPC